MPVVFHALFSVAPILLPAVFFPDFTTRCQPLSVIALPFSLPI